jgi:hypothetical protein
MELLILALQSLFLAFTQLSLLMERGWSSEVEELSTD